MNELAIRNRQRAFPIQTQVLARAALHLLQSELRIDSYALGIHLLSLPAMAKLNRRWLGHDGPTDVITFDHHHADPALDLYGEVFLCPPQAVLQAQRYRIHWTRELTRHLVHGILHLQGYDDQHPRSRRVMKRHENHCLLRLARAIDLRQISGEPSPLKHE